MMITISQQFIFASFYATSLNASLYKYTVKLNHIYTEVGKVLLLGI